MPGVALSQLWQVIGAGETAFKAISLLVVVVGMTGILTALSAGLNERRREMAVLRATGARPRDIFALLILLICLQKDQIKQSLLNLKESLFGYQDHQKNL